MQPATFKEELHQRFFLMIFATFCRTVLSSIFSTNCYKRKNWIKRFKCHTWLTQELVLATDEKVCIFFTSLNKSMVKYFYVNRRVFLKMQSSNFVHDKKRAFALPSVLSASFDSYHRNFIMSFYLLKSQDSMISFFIKSALYKRFCCNW